MGEEEISDDSARSEDIIFSNVQHIQLRYTLIFCSVVSVFFTVKDGE